MKKLALMVGIVACAAVVSAQTVTSANIVGYAKVQAVGGHLTLVALNFDTGGLTLDDLFGNLPSGSAVHLWDKSAGIYRTSNLGRGGFSPNLVLQMGDACWIEAAGTGTNEIILSGDVLMDETNTVAVSAGIEGTGYFYPVATRWGDTDLAAQLPSGSRFHVWNGTGYDSYTKGRGGWGTGDNATIDVAQGFWVEAAAGFTWSEVRPFTP